MAVNQRKLLRHLRRLSFLLVVLGAFYLYQRYDLHDLPEEGCSPVLRFSTGDRLLLDRSPGAFHPGDAVLFSGPDGVLYLAAIDRTRPADAAPGAVEELWLETDDPDCPGADSDDFGWIPVADVRARILLVWPW